MVNSPLGPLLARGAARLVQAVELGGRAGSVNPGLRPHRAQGSGGLVSCSSVEAVLALVPGSLSLGLLIYKMEPMATTPGFPCSGTVL